MLMCRKRHKKKGVAGFLIYLWICGYDFGPLFSGKEHVTVLVSDKCNTPNEDEEEGSKEHTKKR